MSKTPAGAATPQAAPKIMSSRLSNMKFMQRAAVNTPLPPSPATESDEPSAKRQKVSRFTSAHATSTPTKTTTEENALLGGNSTETKWTLVPDDDDGPATQHGLVEETSDEGSLPWQVGAWGVGRMAFGSFKHKSKPKAPDAAPTAREGGGSDDESEDADGDSGNDDREESAGSRRFAEENLARVKAALAAKQRAGRDKTAAFSKQRKGKEVKLNRAGSGRVEKGGGRSISSGGGHR